ncbi:hypothetical protein STEG23_030134, partial [Scotinomys teguina]
FLSGPIHDDLYLVLLQPLDRWWHIFSRRLPTIEICLLESTIHQPQTSVRNLMAKEGLIFNISD